MSQPETIYADTDLVCGEEPKEGHTKYVRADLRPQVLPSQEILKEIAQQNYDTLNENTALRAVLKEIYEVSNGEKQVAPDDTEGMAWIARLIKPHVRRWKCELGNGEWDHDWVEKHDSSGELDGGQGDQWSSRECRVCGKIEDAT